MSQMTDYLEGQIRAHIFRTATFTKPTVIAVALYTAAPGEAGGGTEASGGAYARAQNNPLDANWTAASATDGRTDNAAAMAFPTPTGSWGLITHTAVLDATSAGNMLLYGALTNSKNVNNGDPAPQFNANAFIVTFA